MLSKDGTRKGRMKWFFVCSFEGICKRDINKKRIFSKRNERRQRLKRRCLFLRQRRAKVGFIRNLDLEIKTSNVYNIKVVYMLYIMKNHGEIHYISIAYK